MQSTNHRAGNQVRSGYEFADKVEILSLLSKQTVLENIR